MRQPSQSHCWQELEPLQQRKTRVTLLHVFIDRIRKNRDFTVKMERRDPGAADSAMTLRGVSGKIGFLANFENAEFGEIMGAA